VIRLHDIRQTFSGLKVQIERMVFDSYLLKYIEKPVIDEDKLLVVLSLLNQLELSDKEIKNYALSTMLIQIALDTHEYIMQSSINDKKRQLTVLAGDYFSGLYYQLLAESDDILMIKALSFGIKEINEHKILIYNQNHNDTDKLMNSLKVIESSLFNKLTEYFKVDRWNEVITNLLFFKRLLKERRKFLKEERTILYDAIHHAVFAKNSDTVKNPAKEQKISILGIYDHYLHDSIQTIQRGIRGLPGLNEVLAERISELLNQFQPTAKTFAEEV
jgi:heptaprenyl diphosphate synthase